MNIRCPSCQTVFRVDPAKVPAAGIKAKCSRCAHSFRIGGPRALEALPSPTPSPSPAFAPVRAPIAAAGAAAAPAAPPSQYPSPTAAPAGPRSPVATAPTPPAAPPASTTPPADGPPRRTPVFGSQDPKARAQRIARALVSDIVAYHKVRVEEALASGQLRTEFREEILKSWDEYTAQVGPELAKGTPFFRDALNDILARGQRLF